MLSALSAALIFACADGAVSGGEAEQNRDVASDGGINRADAGSFIFTGDASTDAGIVSDAGCASCGEVVPASNLSLGFDHACFLSDGGVECWGSTNAGRYAYGDGQNADKNCSSPMPMTSLSPGVSAVSAGGHMDCVIINGGVQCWGYVHFPITVDSRPTLTPVTVSGASSGVTALSSGAGHACAIVNGGLKCWGTNQNGQLGNDSTTDSDMTAVDVQGLGSGVTAVSAGTLHTCVIVNGGAQCWGLNVDGELGDGTTTQSLIPVPVMGLQTGVTAISAGDAHTCALVGGKVLCWGANGSGQLGDTSTTGRLVPTPVVGLPTAMAAVSSGYQSTCAITSAGAAMCWGANDFGELGNGSTTNSSAPAPVSGLTTGVTTIGTKGTVAFTCAMKDGRVLCWGNNEFQQLSDGSSGNQSVPTPVLGL
jgi:alpha-tubulin suppressor-like RCC1 family protein